MPATLAFLARIEKIAGLLAAVFMAAIMLISVTDVAMRYVFNKPFAFAYDLISLYLMVGLFYLSLSGAFAQHAHVAVDILHNYMSPTLRRICEMIVCATSALLFSAIAYVGFLRALEAWRNGDVFIGAIEWPTWASIAFVPLGAGLLALRLVLHAFAHLASLGAGAPLIALPPLSGSPEALEHGGE